MCNLLTILLEIGGLSRCLPCSLFGGPRRWLKPYFPDLHIPRKLPQKTILSQSHLVTLFESSSTLPSLLGQGVCASEKGINHGGLNWNIDKTFIYRMHRATLIKNIIRKLHSHCTYNTLSRLTIKPWAKSSQSYNLEKLLRVPSPSSIPVITMKSTIAIFLSVAE